MARAVCIGINDYPGTNSDLSGCVNDARDWEAVLAERGFDTQLLLDGDATKTTMEDSIRQVVTGTSGGEVGVVTFSGHGSWRPDENGDEPDQRDELLCPHDIDQGNYLSDDELYEIFGERERGSRIIFISDSCHSGSVNRFAPARQEDDTPDRIRFLAPEQFLDDTRLSRARAIGNPRVFSRPRASALLLSGCQDVEFSYDASFGGRPNGAFTYVAIRALSDMPAGGTYADWFEAVRSSLPSASHPQTPNLQGTSQQRRWKVFE